MFLKRCNLCSFCNSCVTAQTSYSYAWDLFLLRADAAWCSPWLQSITTSAGEVFRTCLLEAKLWEYTTQQWQYLAFFPNFQITQVSGLKQLSLKTHTADLETTTDFLAHILCWYVQMALVLLMTRKSSTATSNCLFCRQCPMQNWKMIQASEADSTASVATSDASTGRVI